MEIRIKRVAKKPLYTIGHLYVDGKYFCDTLEDTDRGLTQQMTLEQIKRIKVQDKTAIPSGSYRVTLDVKSPKYSNYNRYPWAKAINGCVPRLLNTIGFDGVLIHVGCKAEDTSGCILVGQNKVVGRLINSTITFNKLYAAMKTARGGIYLTIE